MHGTTTYIWKGSHAFLVQDTTSTKAQERIILLGKHTLKII